MAYDYQMGGGYYEGETYEEYQRRQEEERRRQEALNTPVKETIVTNPDGTQEITVKGTREALSSANPNTPTLVRPGEVAPVVPDESAAETERLQRQAQIAQGTPVGVEPLSRSLVPPDIGQNQLPKFGPGVQTASISPDAGFQRMLQVESGNRDYTQQGAPMTSPKGAMFAAQVMPTTAQNPGYGVRPAQAQTPEEYNRVGAEYYQAMLKKYNGNENMARAAYNAGPGRVDKAIAQGQAQGVDPVSLLPRETQDYIRKTAAPAAPAAPAVPVATTGGPGNIGTPPAPGPGVQVASTEPGAGVAEAARIRENNYKVAYEQGQDLGSFDNRFTAASKDPRKLLDLYGDQSLTPEQRTLAGKQAQQLMTQQMGEARGKEELSGMSEVEIARMLKSKTEEGSYAKLLLLGFISPTLALKEANKLGLNDQWEKTTVGGEPVLFKTRDGVPVEGYNGATGSKLGGKELIAAAAQLSRGKVTTGAEFFQDKAGNVYQSQRDEKGNLQFVNTQTNQQYNGKEPLQRLRDIAAVDTKRQTTAIQLAKDIATMDYGAKLKAVEDFRKKEINAGRPDLTSEEISTLIGPPPNPQATVGATAKPGAAPAAAPAVAGTLNPQAQQAAVERMQQAAAVQTGATVAGAPSAPAPSGVLTGRETVDAANRRAAEEKSRREVSTSEESAFVAKGGTVEQIQKKGDDGRFVADTRRTQVQMLTGPNSAIMGIYRGSGDSYTKARAVLRDAIAGAYADPDGGVKLSEDLRNISIPAPELSAIKEFAQMNTGINAKTLAENAGEGPKSNADMTLNQQANMTNIGDIPAFAALTGLTRSQYAGDINKRKQDYLNSNRDRFRTQSQLESEWGKEKDLLNRQYEGIYKARLNYIDSQMVQKYGQDWRKKNDDDTQAFYRNASIHSFNVLPTPNYDVQTQKFVYPTEQSKLAAMRAITGK